MSEARPRIGDMLVDTGLIAADQLGQALESQKKSGRRVGEELVALGFISELQMTQALSKHLSIPWVSLYHVEFSRELLSLVPANVADEYGALPIYVRRVRNEGDTVFVAMDDPTDLGALSHLHDLCGFPVKPMIAPPTEVRNAIRVYYFGGRHSGRTIPPESPPAAAPKTRAKIMQSEAPPDPEVEIIQPDEATAEEARDMKDDDDQAKRASAAAESKPPAGPSKSPRMITLTMLDGTRVNLPSPGSTGKGVAPEHSLTAADLVSALHARAEGKDVSEVIGKELGWERLFATMLTLLIRKGLIADWEFVDELKDHQD